MARMCCAIGSALQPVPSAHMVKFGSITASGNAILRLEIEEVELLSAHWNTTMQVPVCGASHWCRCAHACGHSGCYRISVAWCMQAQVTLAA